jgi:hypothetical protein
MANRFSALCAAGDGLCAGKVAAKIVDDGPGAYPLTLISLSSELIAGASGTAELRYRACFRNDTDRDLVDFAMVLSPAMALVGRPVGAPPIHLLHIDRLARGETGYFHSDALSLELPQAGQIPCHDPAFRPTGA